MTIPERGHRYRPVICNCATVRAAILENESTPSDRSEGALCLESSELVSGDEKFKAKHCFKWWYSFFPTDFASSFVWFQDVSGDCL